MITRTGRCDNCKNMATVFIRARMYVRGKAKMLCAHCCDLEVEQSGRGGGKLVKFPRNQPVPVTMFGKSEPCVLCSSPATPRYRWPSGNGNIVACGWDHAGTWMDAQMGFTEVDDYDLAAGLEYVKQSLGIEDPDAPQ